MTHEIDIDSIIVPEDRIRQDVGQVELQALADDIEAKGMIQPILLLEDLTLVSGGRRLEACKLLGMKTIRAEIREDIGEEQLIAYEASENNNRKPFQVSEIAKTAHKIWEQVEVEPGQVRRDAVGKFLGISGVHAQRCMRLYEADGPDCPILAYADEHGARAAEVKLEKMKDGVTVTSEGPPKVNAALLNEKANAALAILANKLGIEVDTNLIEAKANNDTLSLKLDEIVTQIAMIGAESVEAEEKPKGKVKKAA